MKKKLINLSKLVVILSLTLIPSIVHADTINVPIEPINEAQFIQGEQGVAISIPGLSSIASPGDPNLPVKEIKVIVPPDTIESSISVKIEGDNVTALSAKYDISAVPPYGVIVDEKEFLDWGEGKTIVDGKNINTYESDEFFPKAKVELTTIGNLRKWKILSLKY